MSAFSIVADFEKRVAEYAGAREAVAVDCCTSAIFLSLKYRQSQGQWAPYVEVPARTYASVPMAVIHSGMKPKLVDRMRVGTYELNPIRVVDGAKRFRP